MINGLTVLLELHHGIHHQAAVAMTEEKICIVFQDRIKKIDDTALVLVTENLVAVLITVNIAVVLLNILNAINIIMRDVIENTIEVMIMIVKDQVCHVIENQEAAVGVERAM